MDKIFNLKTIAAFLFLVCAALDIYLKQKSPLTYLMQVIAVGVFFGAVYMLEKQGRTGIGVMLFVACAVLIILSFRDLHLPGIYAQ